MSGNLVQHSSCVGLHPALHSLAGAEAENLDPGRRHWPPGGGATHELTLVRTAIGTADRDSVAGGEAHVPPAGVDLGQADPCSARRQDRRGHTSEVPRRSFSRAGGVAGVCGRSVGTGADVSAPAGSAGRSGTDFWHAPQVMELPVRDGSTWAKGGFQRNTRFEGRTSSVSRLARQGSDWRAPRCPPRTAPGRPGGQRATHATLRPVTDGSGNAFAMRRSGVRIPAAPPTDTPSDQRKW